MQKTDVNCITILILIDMMVPKKTIVKGRNFREKISAFPNKSRRKRGNISVLDYKKAQLKIQVYRNEFPCFVSSNKAQLKIQEMAFMLLAVVLFFTLVGLFVLTLVYSNLHDEATRINEERTISAVSSLADTPELSCVAAKSNCIDGDKLVSLLGKQEYAQFWPFSSLKVIQFNGLEKNESALIDCNFANYPDCDLYVIYDRHIPNERAIHSFVSLCRKEYENGYVYDHCELAKIIAGTELKNAA